MHYGNNKCLQHSCWNAKHDRNTQKSQGHLPWAPACCHNKALCWVARSPGWSGQWEGKAGVGKLLRLRMPEEWHPCLHGAIAETQRVSLSHCFVELIAHMQWLNLSSWHPALLDALSILPAVRRVCLCLSAPFPVVKSVIVAKSKRISKNKLICSPFPCMGDLSWLPYFFKNML